MYVDYLATFRPILIKRGYKAVQPDDIEVQVEGCD